MPKTKISEFSSTPASNTDIDSINISEGCAPSGINDAIRELMAQLKDFQTGAVGDSFNGPVGTTTAAAGAFTTLSSTGNTTLGDASGDSVTINGTATFANANPTLSAGTANGVAYLNGSKVVTSGSALTFDGTTLKNSIANFASIVAQSAGDTDTNFQAISSTCTTILASNSTGGYIGTFTASKPLVFYTGSAEGMRLTSTGLGIGTSSPAYKLEVQTSTTSAALWAQTGGITSGHTITDFRTGTNASAFATFGDTSSVWQGGGMTLNSSGNLGLGVTPSAWDSAFKAFQFNTNSALAGTSNRTFLGQNWYDSASGGKFVGTGYALRYDQLGSNGQHQWYTSTASGTAGNAITFTQAMTLDADGDLGIGTTSPSRKLDVQVASDGIAASFGKSGGTMQPRLVVKASEAASTVTIGTDYAGATSPSLVFETGATERARIDSSGNFGIGNASAVGKLEVYQNNNSGIPSIYARQDGTAPIQTWNVAGGTERARIDSSGNLLVGTTSVANSSKVTFGFTPSTQNGLSINDTEATEVSIGYINFSRSGTSKGSITYNNTTGITSYNTTSDYRAKDISGPVTDSGSVIDSIPVYIAKMKGATQERPMFIAHETPSYAHTGVKDAVDADGNPVYQQMDASALIPVMWAEIQSLRKRLADAGIA